MSDPVRNSEPSHVRPRRRRWLYFLVFLSLAVLAWLGLYTYITVANDLELQAALAETDKL